MFLRRQAAMNGRQRGGSRGWEDGGNGRHRALRRQTAQDLIALGILQPMLPPEPIDQQ